MSCNCGHCSSTSTAACRRSSTADSRMSCSSGRCSSSSTATCQVMGVIDLPRRERDRMLAVPFSQTNERYRRQKYEKIIAATSWMRLKPCMTIFPNLHLFCLKSYYSNYYYYSQFLFNLPTFLKLGRVSKGESLGRLQQVFYPLLPFHWHINTSPWMTLNGYLR